ncbi:Endonuclease/exonuclease/phosphatase [Pseudocohnilembus persalinus]|uniref:Endonuclease/exonuclease/phosphatase n=1 Tax=Pseudocohnilembus persalinus TaxID=266149 RepID=A0A0V0R5Q6_PSEPJ|nr:Endonuclease/exonuclease/phosphatase [Pseudocohnilembus persalinus]|eukprot:KRX09837.1 Endonuclease/exonuclease/phosphatase [Pseudocohnilembus persalinus]
MPIFSQNELTNNCLETCQKIVQDSILENNNNEKQFFQNLIMLNKNFNLNKQKEILNLSRSQYINNAANSLFLEDENEVKIFDEQQKMLEQQIQHSFNNFAKFYFPFQSKFANYFSPLIQEDNLPLIDLAIDAIQKIQQLITFATNNNILISNDDQNLINQSLRPNQLRILGFNCSSFINQNSYQQNHNKINNIINYQPDVVLLVETDANNFTEKIQKQLEKKNNRLNKIIHDPQKKLLIEEIKREIEELTSPKIIERFPNPLNNDEYNLLSQSPMLANEPQKLRSGAAIYLGNRLSNSKYQGLKKDENIIEERNLQNAATIQIESQKITFVSVRIQAGRWKDSLKAFFNNVKTIQDQNPDNLIICYCDANCKTIKGSINQALQQNEKNFITLKNKFNSIGMETLVPSSPT